MTKTWDSTLGDSVKPARARPKWTVRVVAVAGRVHSEGAREIGVGVTPIGRAVPSAEGPGGGIVIRDPRVSRVHASIEITRGEARIVRRGDAPLRLDGVLTDDGALADGSVVVLGTSALVVRHRPPEPEASLPSWGLIGESPGAIALRRTIRMIGPTKSTVLLLGESGTGKELVARGLHEASGRKGPIVAVNTSAIPGSLAEAYLFGHVAGAYTGASSAGTGVFRAAEGGTLFLDELGDLPAELQPKLLRVLEDRVVVPVGTTKGVQVDVRVVCATNKDLLGEVDAGRFRGDLYARISDFTIELPRLADRREDILALLAASLEADLPPIDAELLVELLSRPYRFNVRELKKLATQLNVRGKDAERLTLEMIDKSETADGGARPVAEPAPSSGEIDGGNVPSEDELKALLTEHQGVIEAVAQKTGRSRRQVHRWLEKYGIDVTSFRRK